MATLTASQLTREIVRRRTLEGYVIPEPSEDDGIIFKIDKGIPLPRQVKYPFREMDVGDSFFVPNERLSQAESRASTVGKKIGRKFIVYPEGCGCRFWRVD